MKISKAIIGVGVSVISLTAAIAVNADVISPGSIQLITNNNAIVEMSTDSVGVLTETAFDTGTNTQEETTGAAAETATTSETEIYIGAKKVTKSKQTKKTAKKTKGTKKAKHTKKSKKKSTKKQIKKKSKCLGTFKVTAYCGCARCCGKSNGVTSSGKRAAAGRTIAADTSRFSFGTKLKINGHTYTVEDRGGAISGNRIDIYFASHSEALAWGVRYCKVYAK